MTLSERAEKFARSGQVTAIERIFVAFGIPALLGMTGWVLLMVTDLQSSDAAQAQQIADHDRRISSLEAARTADRAVQSQISERLARIEQRQDEVSRGIGDVKSLLDRLIWERGTGDSRGPDWPPTQR